MKLSDQTRVVVTGMGAVSPLGTGVAVLWEGLTAGRVGLRPITLFDASPFRNREGGEVPGFEHDPDRHRPRALRFLLAAAGEAWDDSGLRAYADFDPQRADVILGTNFGCMSAIEPALEPGHDGECSEAGIAPYAFQHAADEAAALTGAGGERSVISLACASGTAVLSLGAQAIVQQRADVVLCGAYDELSLFCYAGLSALRAITPDRIRPFDINRKGTQFGEGAGVLILESYEYAAKRGATVHAELIGHAINNDAYHMTAPEKDGRGIRALMTAALRHARLQPADVDHINCHATGTPYNDLIETTAIKAVFGEHAARLRVTANKSMIGHAMGAAGALEAIATVRTLQDGVIPPTVGIEQQDPACDLDCCPGAAQEVDVHIAMSNSFGLGGTNACVVFRRWETRG